MISKINSYRLANGLKQLGFLNPLLYQLYDETFNEISGDYEKHYFRDITEGYNQGCSVDNNIGFYAAKGFDPITGVGVIDFGELLNTLLET